jgi:hypothetical protein
VRRSAPRTCVLADRKEHDAGPEVDEVHDLVFVLRVVVVPVQCGGASGLARGESFSAPALVAGGDGGAQPVAGPGETPGEAGGAAGTLGNRTGAVKEGAEGHPLQEDQGRLGLHAAREQQTLHGDLLRRQRRLHSAVRLGESPVTADLHRYSA